MSDDGNGVGLYDDMYRQYALTREEDFVTLQAADDLAREGVSPDDTEVLRARVAQQHLVREVPGIVELDPPGSQRDEYEWDADGRPARIYYASFGSNLFADRFHTYVEGGQIEGSARTYPGCRDKTLPTDDIPVALNGTIHYAGQSGAWGGGVAFLDVEAKGKSLGRAYNISAQQFDDVVAQESAEAPGSRHTDMKRLLNEGKIVGSGPYGTLVHVGDYNGAPVFTFTGDFTTRDARDSTYTYTPDGAMVRSDSRAARGPSRLSRAVARLRGKDVTPSKPNWAVFRNAPTDEYKKMIAAGLAETHGLTAEQSDVYFRGSSGVGY